MHFTRVGFGSLTDVEVAAAHSFQRIAEIIRRHMNGIEAMYGVGADDIAAHFKHEFRLGVVVDRRREYQLHLRFGRGA